MTCVPVPNVANELTIGFVRKPHGLDGVFNVESASGEYAHFAALSKVELRKADKTLAGDVTFVEATSSHIFMSLFQINSADDARLWAGADIVVPRAYARPLGDDEWYITDLIGCSLVFDGKAIGTVTDVIDGAGSLLQVALSNKKMCYVPLSRKFIGDVDVVHKMIVLLVDWVLE